MTPPLLRLSNVGFRYPEGSAILRGLDFALEPEERIGLLGANGCGKTTLLHLLVGLLRPTSGEIEAFGRVRIAETDFHEVRRRVGLVFQDPDDQLFCPTVLDDCAFGPLNLGKEACEAKARAARALASVGLSGFEQRITYKLSGGEKRLVSLATVLAMDPDVLLLDEPVAGLDDNARSRVTGVLNDVTQAMIVVSHDHAFLNAVTMRSLVFRGGKLMLKT